MAKSSKKFGKTSMLFDGIGDYTTYPKDWEFPKGQFTLEAFFIGTKSQAKWLKKFMLAVAAIGGERPAISIRTIPRRKKR